MSWTINELQIDGTPRGDMTSRVQSQWSGGIAAGKFEDLINRLLCVLQVGVSYMLPCLGIASKVNLIIPNASS